MRVSARRLQIARATSMPVTLGSCKSSTTQDGSRRAARAMATPPTLPPSNPRSPEPSPPTMLPPVSGSSRLRSRVLSGGVLDLQLPKVTGIEVARAIWSRRADTRILFWSNFADEAYVRGVARIVPPGSVYGYVLKSASEAGMRSALRGVLREGHCIIDLEILA